MTHIPGQPEHIIVPRARDIGEFEVRRALPSAERMLVGPFIFFDQMGPVEFLTGQGIDVKPHPHIGLATVTYLYQGEFEHRDSLGTHQMIYPGEVNWMVAGRGVTHSERTSQVARSRRSTLYGVQTWVALPEAHEDVAPTFQHAAKADLPVVIDTGVQARLIVGEAYGERSPVATFSRMFYLDVVLDAGATFPLPDDHEDRAVYVLSGDVSVAGVTYGAHRLLVFRPGDAIAVTAQSPARLMVLGGETLNGPRHIYWNFVSSSREKLEAAKAAWKAADFENGPFRLPPGDEDEFVPL